jgi:hypothetical protein
MIHIASAQVKKGERCWIVLGSVARLERRSAARRSLCEWMSRVGEGGWVWWFDVDAEGW